MANAKGFTPLHMAAQACHKYVVQGDVECCLCCRVTLPGVPWFKAYTMPSYGID